MWRHLFTFLVSRFLSDFEAFSNKRNNRRPVPDSNPGPLACEASMLPFCHGRFLYEIAKICNLILQVSTFFVRISCFISIFIYLFATLISIDEIRIQIFHYVFLYGYLVVFSLFSKLNEPTLQHKYKTFFLFCTSRQRFEICIFFEHGIKSGLIIFRLLVLLQFLFGTTIYEVYSVLPVIAFYKKDHHIRKALPSIQK